MNQEIPAFNLTTNKWTSIHTHGDVNCNSEVPQARRCHGAVQYTDDVTGNIQVVISGGYTGFRRFDDMWRLDLVRRQWTQLKSHSLPCRVYFHSVGLTPFGKMYTFGGIVGDNSDPVSYYLYVFYICTKSIVMLFLAKKNKKSSFNLVKNT